MTRCKSCGERVTFKETPRGRDYCPRCGTIHDEKDQRWSMDV